MIVEIRNSEKMHQDTSSIIRPESAAHMACLEVEEAVYDQIKKSCPNCWRSISFSMRGPRWQHESRKPTIMVAVTPRTKHTRSAVESQIQGAAIGLTGSLDIELYVEVRPGAPTSFEMRPALPFVVRDLPVVQHQ